MKRKAFTLIEILVIVFIFWVGILAVLQLLTRSLGYFDAITMKTKATLLAKEGIEIAYGFRDSNIEQGYPWNFLSFDENSQKETYLWSEWKTVFKVWFKGGETYRDFEPSEKKETFEENFKAFYLELYTGDSENTLAYYHHTPQNELPSKGFARILEFSPIKEWEAELDPNKILKITSRVLYKRGSSTGEVVLESFIGMKDSLPAEKTATN